MAGFNFMDCPGLWETKVHLVRRATNLKILVQDSKGRKRVSPTLSNLELNLASSSTAPKYITSTTSS